MGVILTKRPTDEQLLSPDAISALSSTVLLEKMREVSKRRDETRVRLIVMLAGVASQCKEPLPAIAESMELTERELGDLITLMRRDERFLDLIMRFLLACGVADPQALKEVVDLASDFDKLVKLYVQLSKERIKRDREREDKLQAPPARELLPPAETIADAPGHDSKPDPLEARTAEEFVDAMRRYRIWAGNPSLRTMAARCGQQVSHGTFRNILRASTVPERLETVKAFVTALGGTTEDRMRWATAWRHFTVPQPGMSTQKVTLLRLTGT